MAFIHLIRHGQASFGSANYDCLSPIGHRQGQVLGEHYAREGQSFEVCIAGEMDRQQKTAHEVMQRLPGTVPGLVTDPAFNEYDSDGIFKAFMPSVLRDDPGLAELLKEDYRAMFRDKAIFQRAFVNVVRHWSEDAPHAHENLEPWVAFIERVQNALSRIRDNHDSKAHVAVFTSGGAISIAFGTTLGLAPREALMLSWGIANSSITELYVSESGVFVNGFNNFTHLKLAGDPSLITYR